MGDVVQLSRPQSVLREERDKAIWLQCWKRAWSMEAGKGKRKTLERAERQAMAHVVSGMIDQLKVADRGRLAKVHDALANASQNIKDVAYRRDRDCPKSLQVVSPRAGGRQDLNYRVERFDRPDRDDLRGKLVDWLAVVEALGEQLGVAREQQVARFHSEYHDRLNRKRPDEPATGLAQAYTQLFADLADDLRRICADVARRHDIASYYHFADQASAWWHEDRFQFNEGEAQGFFIPDFASGIWQPLQDLSPYVDVSCLGAVGDILVHVPIAGLDFRYAEVSPEHAHLFYLEPAADPYLISLELEIHLVLRPDAQEPGEAGGLLIYPYVGLAGGAGEESQEDPARRFRGSVVPTEFSKEGLRFLEKQLPRPSSPYLEDQRRLAFAHCGEIRIEPLTAQTCREWLSAAGGNLNTEFAEFFSWPGGDLATDQPSVLPPFTLGGALQMNLLIPDSSEQVCERIDQLLDREAARKVASARAALEERKAAYRARRSGPERSSALPPINDEGDDQ